MSAHPAWKKAERGVARMFGTERNPLSGEMSRHKTGSDSLHEELYIETKRSKALNKALQSLIGDTMLCAAKEKKLPLIAFKVHSHRGFLFLMRDADLLRIASIRARVVLDNKAKKGAK